MQKEEGVALGAGSREGAVWEVQRRMWEMWQPTKGVKNRDLSPRASHKGFAGKTGG